MMRRGWDERRRACVVKQNLTSNHYTHVNRDTTIHHCVAHSRDVNIMQHASLFSAHCVVYKTQHDNQQYDTTSKLLAVLYVVI